MTKLYAVALRARNLPMRERTEAEVRFARELEMVLGGEVYVGQTYAAWLDVAQSDANRIDKSTAMTAARWPVALAAATPVGFSKLRGVGEAHFDVRLERHARTG
jgi:hypothetical protein